jgi:hypothetical protein
MGCLYLKFEKENDLKLIERQHTNNNPLRQSKLEMSIKNLYDLKPQINQETPNKSINNNKTNIGDTASNTISNFKNTDINETNKFQIDFKNQDIVFSGENEVKKKNTFLNYKKKIQNFSTHEESDFANFNISKK